MAEHEQVSAQRILMLLTGFLMLTLIGVFATYAAPVPPMRGVIGETTLVQATASGNPDAMRAALTHIKPLLGVRAQKTLATLTPDRAGLARAAQLLKVETGAASALVSYRLRLMVIVIGVLAGLFGIALLGIRVGKSTPTITEAPPTQGNEP